MLQWRLAYFCFCIDLGVLMKLLLCFLLSCVPLFSVMAQNSQTDQPAGVSGDNTLPTSKLEGKSRVNAAEVLATDWRENLLVSVPSTICADDTWHRECFNVRESQCLSATSDVTNDCVDYVESQQVASAMTTSQLFEQTRVCVITLYERRFARRFKFIQRCTDRTKW